MSKNRSQAASPSSFEVRTRWLNYDARHTPQTEIYCCRCQKDIQPGSDCRWVYLTGDMTTVHPAELSGRPVEESDFGWKRIGPAVPWNPRPFALFPLHSSMPAFAGHSPVLKSVPHFPHFQEAPCN